MANNRNNSGNATNGGRASGTNNGGQSKAQKRRARRQRAGQDGSSAPAAVGTGFVAQGPAIVGGPRGTVRFSNREFVTDVAAGISGTAGPVVTLSLNPANTAAFPWLSRIATGYELYRFRRLVVSYTPTCSSNTSGMIVMAFDYDATDNPPTSKQVLSGYDGATRGNVWNKQTCAAKPMSGWYYTGQVGSLTSNPTGTDLKMYDLGKFYLGVYNQAAAGVVGELTVEYDVEFSKPDTAVLTGLSERATFTGGTVADPINSSVAPTITGSQIFTFATQATRTFLMLAQAPGEYKLEVVLALTSSDGSALSSISQLDPGNQVSSSVPVLEQITNYTAPGSYVAIILVAVAVSVGSTLTFTIASGPTAAALLRVRVASYRKSLA